MAATRAAALVQVEAIHKAIASGMYRGSIDRDGKLSIAIYRE